MLSCSEDDCEILDKSREINDFCKEQGEVCEVSLIDTSTIDVWSDDVTYAGQDFLWIKYKCEPCRYSQP